MAIARKPFGGALPTFADKNPNGPLPPDIKARLRQLVLRARNRSERKSANRKLSVVFCQGIWADGSCFNKVFPPLKADGHKAIAVQCGLETNKGDVAMVKAVLGQVSNPAILVGHSFAGSVTLVTQS